MLPPMLMQILDKENMMADTFDLMTIYGIPPARYSEDNPDDLFLKGLPSLEQIAAYNLANAQYMAEQNSQTGSQMQSVGAQQVPGIGTGMSTPTTAVNGDDVNSLASLLSIQTGSASGELPSIGGDNLTQLITDYSKPYPVTAESIQYLNGFIRTQIGRRAQIQFLMGNSELIEKDGFLLGVGANYILINEIGTNDITACDFYNIKFIRFLY